MVTSNNSNQNPNNFMFGQNPKNNWHQIGRVVYTVIVAVAAFYYRLLQYVDTHPEVFKIWFGPDLHIVTSRLNDADIILTDYLEKSSSYRFGHLCFGNGLVTSRGTLPICKKSKMIKCL
jgi:hypothetical protein